MANLKPVDLSILAEDVLTLAEATKELAPLLGRRPDKTTMYRWGATRKRQNRPTDYYEQAGHHSLHRSKGGRRMRCRTANCDGSCDRCRRNELAKFFANVADTIREWGDLRFAAAMLVESAADDRFAVHVESDHTTLKEFSRLANKMPAVIERLIAGSTRPR